MTSSTLSFGRFALMPLLGGAAILLHAASMVGAADSVDFLNDIKPILAAHCIDCHGEDTQESGFRLDTGTAMLAGGYSGPAIVAGNSAESLLIKAVTGNDDEVSKMPPEGPALAEAEIELLANWIDEGAKVPEAPVPVDNRRASEHWSFQPLQRAKPPLVEGSADIRNPIDAFIVGRLRSEGLTPSPAADKSTLIRRVTLDLTGLLPTIDQIDAFLADNRNDAYQRLVDRLLSSPHYGERWGRHWLDLARYADSNGYTIDSARSIWKYRDWVIGAFNRDLPFDQFAIEQLAGDLLPSARLDQIIATGFHRNTMVNEEGGTDDEQFRVEAVADRVATTGVVFLGLTLGCARCHDHKYDPISQREFYELFAIFNNSDEPTLPLPTDEQAEQLATLETQIKQAEEQLAEIDASSQARMIAWEKSLANADLESLKLEPATRDAVATPAEKRSEAQRALALAAFQNADPERTPIAARIAQLKGQKNTIDSHVIKTLVVRERAEPRETHIHLRGDFLQHGATVEPGVPEVLPAISPRGEQPDRLDLARWLVTDENPLTARVTVNRLWQHYFGRGLVATENDFGTQGDRPTHPELLDWLALRFIESGWRLKSLHRLVLTSATYRQSSQRRDDLATADPYNRLLGRQQRLRLEAESIRDVALAASGLLSMKIGGPSVFPPQPEGIYRFTQKKQSWVESRGADRFRRGMYTHLWRSSPDPFLKTFDLPEATVACTRRARSNTPLQALTLANDVAFFELAQGFAADLLCQSVSDDYERLRLAFRRCLAREATTEEFSKLMGYLKTQEQQFAEAAEDAAAVAPDNRPRQVDVASAAAWTMVARVMLNLDEFITRE